MHQKQFLIILLLFLIPVSFALQITEVMYFPEFDENYNEYIEIYNDEQKEIDITLLTLCNSNLLSGYISTNLTKVESSNLLPPNAYAIITDGGTGSQVLENYNVKTHFLFHPDSSSLCSRLSNSGKEISILKNEEPLVSFEYKPICNKGESFYKTSCNLPSPGYSLDLLETKTKNNSEQNFDSNKSEIVLEQEPKLLTNNVSQQEAQLLEKSTDETSFPPKTSNIVYCSNYSKIKFYLIMLFCFISILLNIILILILANK